LLQTAEFVTVMFLYRLALIFWSYLIATTEAE